MELKKGMYVMTNDRMKIGKIKDFCTCEMCEKREFYEPVIDTDICITDYDKSRGFHGYKFYANLIDLIEVGDYVNGKEVTYVYPNLIKVDSTDIWEIHSRDIKSIVTKEQFESMEYRLGD